MKTIVSFLLLTVLMSCSKQPEISSNNIEYNYTNKLVYQKGSILPFSGRVIHLEQIGKEIYQYKEGKRHGLQRMYHNNNKINVESFYNNGVIKSSKKFHADGPLWVEKIYQKGLMSLELEYHRNGQLHRKTDFILGKIKDGHIETYRENGRLFSRTPYKNGKKNGTEEIYNFDGKEVSRVQKYKNGERVR